MGFDQHDVRYIVPTHLDVDHAGGLDDFPHARVMKFERAAHHQASQQTPQQASAAGEEA